MSLTARISRLLLVALFGAVVGFPASADQNSPSASSGAAAYSAAAARAAAVAAVRANQVQQTSVQAVQQSAQQAALISSPSQNVVVTTAAPAQAASAGGGTTTIRTVPDPYAPTMNATAPCRVALSAGVAVVGVGISAGGSVEDVPCVIMNLSNSLAARGHPAAAVKILCLDERSAWALGPALCPASTPAPVAVTAERACWQDEIIAKRMGAPVCG